MIQTVLLPYPNFRASVACYSNLVLSQTLRLLTSHRECIETSARDIGRCSQEKRLIWILWSQWQQAFDCFGMMCAEEAALRDISCKQALACFSPPGLIKVRRWRKPLWIGWERLHSNHRAALLQLGEIERIRHRIIKWKRLEDTSCLVQENSVNDWFDEHDFCHLQHGSSADNVEANDYLTSQGAPPLDDQYPNHYSQFNWDEQPCGNITAWPIKPGVSWICET